MASTKPTDISVKKRDLREINNALTLLDNPNSGNPQAPNEKPVKYKYLDQSQTRYDLMMDFAEVATNVRVVEKIRMDFVRIHMDEQVKVLPEVEGLTGVWLHQASKAIDKMHEEEVVMSIRKIPLSKLDLKTNNLPFTVIAILKLAGIIEDDTEPVDNNADAETTDD